MNATDADKTVTLASGGPPMVVEDFHPATAACRWRDKSGKTRRASFPVVCLVRPDGSRLTPESAAAMLAFRPDPSEFHPGDRVRVVAEDGHDYGAGVIRECRSGTAVVHLDSGDGGSFPWGHIRWSIETLPEVS